jgi:polysaccharide export outer membrane protein
MQQGLLQSVVRIVTTILICVAAPSYLQADEPKAPAAAPEYRIGSEDVLDISVRNNAELEKVVPVRPDGKISLPLVNDIGAAGLTPMELRDVLTEKFAAYIQNPEVSVVVREIHSLKVSVIGNVKAPGRYELKGAATVLDALALATGFNEFAARRKISILRRDGATQQRIRFDYDAAVKGDGEKNMLVKPGDIIIVP